MLSRIFLRSSSVGYPSEMLKDAVTKAMLQAQNQCLNPEQFMDLIVKEVTLTNAFKEFLGAALRRNLCRGTPVGENRGEGVRSSRQGCDPVGEWTRKRPESYRVSCPIRTRSDAGARDR